MNKLEATIIRHSIDGQSESQAVDARQLHAWLENGDMFANWIRERLQQYGFVEGIDYVSYLANTKKPTGGRPGTEYALTVDMAKELAMVERNAKGKEARLYFIEMERKANQFSGMMPQSMPQALRLAAELYERTEKQAAVIKALAPKAEFYDQVGRAINSQTVEEVAKVLGTGRNRVFNWLRKSGVLMKSNLPYQRFVDRGFFAVAERSYVDGRGESRTYTRTLVTGKGFQLIAKHWGQPLLVIPEENALAA